MHLQLSEVCFVLYGSLFNMFVFLVPATTIPPLPSPPEVQALCSVVVWYQPDLSCEHITGYNVRLFNPQSTHQDVIRYVGANRTFYIVKDEDRLDANDAIHVQVDDYCYNYYSVCMAHVYAPPLQVRVLYNGEIRQWSESISLGIQYNCMLYLSHPKQVLHLHTQLCICSQNLAI